MLLLDSLDLPVSLFLSLLVGEAGGRHALRRARGEPKRDRGQEENVSHGAPPSAAPRPRRVPAVDSPRAKEGPIGEFALSALSPMAARGIPSRGFASSRR